MRNKITISLIFLLINVSLITLYAQDFKESFTLSHNLNSQNGANYNNIEFISSASNKFKWDKSDGANKSDKLWYIIGSIGVKSLKSSGYVYNGTTYLYNDYSGNSPGISQPQSLIARVVLVNGLTFEEKFYHYGGPNFDKYGGERSSPHRLQDFQISSVQILNSADKNIEQTIKEFLKKKKGKSRSIKETESKENPINSSPIYKSQQTSDANQTYTQELIINQKLANENIDNLKNKVDNMFQQIIDDKIENHIDEAEEERRIRERSNQQKAEMAVERNRKEEIRKKKIDEKDYALTTISHFNRIFQENETLNKISNYPRDTLYGITFRNLSIPKKIIFQNIQTYDYNINKSSIHTFVRPKNLDYKLFEKLVSMFLWENTFGENNAAVTNIAITEKLENFNIIYDDINELQFRSKYSSVSFKEFNERYDYDKFLNAVSEFNSSITDKLVDYDRIPIFPGVENFAKEVNYDKVQVYQKLRKKLLKTILRKLDTELLFKNIPNDTKALVIKYKLSKDGESWHIIDVNENNTIIIDEFKRVFKTFPKIKNPAKKGDLKVDFFDEFKLKLRGE